MQVNARTYMWNTMQRYLQTDMKKKHCLDKNMAWATNIFPKKFQNIPKDATEKREIATIIAFSTKQRKILQSTLNSSESTWPPPFSTGVYWNEEPAPEGQRDKEINFSQFILSLFDGVGQLHPEDFAGLLMSRPRLLSAGCRGGFLEVYRVWY